MLYSIRHASFYRINCYEARAASSVRGFGYNFTDYSFIQTLECLKFDIARGVKFNIVVFNCRVNIIETYRDGDILLQLLIFSEEFLVSASYLPADASPRPKSSTNIWICRGPPVRGPLVISLYLLI